MKVSRSSTNQNLQFINGKTYELSGLKTPKSKEICEETHQLVEKYTELGLFSMTHVIPPCFLFPRVIVSYYKYFTTDSGNDAFDLPVTIW